MKSKYIFKTMLAAFVAFGAMLSVSSCSDDDDDLPFHTSRLHSFGPSPADRGGEITILGYGLGDVREVVFPVDVHVTSFVSKADDKIVVTVPQEAVPGQIRLVMAGGEEITSRSIISFNEEPEVTSVAPTTVKIGDVVTVTGEYLYNIASITFGNDYELSNSGFATQTRNELTFRVPAEAASGEITFSNGGDWALTWETPLEVSAPAVTAVSATAVDFGDNVTVAGTGLDQIEKISFPGQAEAYFTVNADGSEVAVEVPLDTKSGAVSATLLNGAVISLFDVTLPEIAYSSISPAKDIVAGKMLTITGSLLDRVKEIRFPGGASVAYGSWTVSDDGTQIDVKAPEGIVDGKLTLVQNSNIAVDTESISTRKMGNVIWTGNIDFGGWSGYLQIASECNDDVWDTFSKEIKGPGTLTLHFDEDASSTYWQIATVYRSDWNTQFEGATASIYELEAGASTLQVRVTEADYQMLQGAGWVFKGCYITLTAVEWEGEGGGQDTPGTTVWSGNLALDGSWGSFEQIPASAFESLADGNSLVFTYSVPGTGDAQVKPMDGNWTPLSAANAANEWACIGLDGSGSYEMPLSADDVAALKSSGMILSGQHVTITAVAIK